MILKKKFKLNNFLHSAFLSKIFQNLFHIKAHQKAVTFLKGKQRNVNIQILPGSLKNS